MGSSNGPLIVGCGIFGAFTFASSLFATGDIGTQPPKSMTSADGINADIGDGCRSENGEVITTGEIGVTTDGDGVPVESANLLGLSC